MRISDCSSDVCSSDLIPDCRTLNFLLTLLKEPKYLTSGKIHHKYGRSVKYILSVLLSVVFLYFAFQNVNVSDVFYHISRASLLWIVVFEIGRASCRERCQYV